jgi:ribosomal-protein-alanine N-acetyltransferase
LFELYHGRVGLPVIRTVRLILVPFAAGDLEALYTLWIDAEVRRYLWDDVVITRERAAKELDGALRVAASDAIGHWTVRKSEDGPIIGDCGFRFVEETGEVELMYCLRPEFWGRGLALEACRAVLEFLWRTADFSGVVARADIPNTASIRLMERLGMQYDSNDGVLVKYVLARPA